MKHARSILTLAIILHLCPPAFAQNQSSSEHSWNNPGLNFMKKSQVKEASRWTLQEWMAQKDRNAFMDMWLMAHTPSPYEFYVSGSSNTDKTTLSRDTPGSVETSQDTRSFSGSAGAYAYLVGLQGEYENNTEQGFNDLSGSLNFRLFGHSVQGTHLILGGGQRTRNSTSSASPLRQEFGQGDLEISIVKAFGIRGLYRGFLKGTDETLGDVTGKQIEAGLFLDFGPLRVFGHWYQEDQISEKSNVIQTKQRSGVQSGLKIFF